MAEARILERYRGVPIVLDPARPPGSIVIEPAPKWVRVECPACGKFVCNATPGSKVHIVCNRCKTESVTTVTA